MVTDRKLELTAKAPEGASKDERTKSDTFRVTIAQGLGLQRWQQDPSSVASLANVSQALLSAYGGAALSVDFFNTHGYEMYDTYAVFLQFVAVSTSTLTTCNGAAWKFVGSRHGDLAANRNYLALHFAAEHILNCFTLT